MTTDASSAVIEFPQHRVRPAALREAGTCPGEVVIFCGVRIERLPEEPEAIEKARGGIGRKGRGQRR
jgi:hypothetical protein